MPLGAICSILPYSPSYPPILRRILIFFNYFQGVCCTFEGLRIGAHILLLFLVSALEGYFLLILFSHYLNLRQDALEAANVPTVGFSAAVAEGETAYPNAYAGDLPKKQPPPPYAV